MGRFGGEMRLPSKTWRTLRFCRPSPRRSHGVLVKVEGRRCSLRPTGFTRVGTHGRGPRPPVRWFRLTNTYQISVSTSNSNSSYPVWVQAFIAIAKSNVGLETAGRGAPSFRTTRSRQTCVRDFPGRPRQTVGTSGNCYEWREECTAEPAEVAGEIEVTVLREGSPAFSARSPQRRRDRRELKR